MIDLEQLQLLAQLADSMEIAIEKLEKAYQNNDSENFEKAKGAAADFQNKISNIIEAK